jgi:hypothetical protein
MRAVCQMAGRAHPRSRGVGVAARVVQCAAEAPYLRLREDKGGNDQTEERARARASPSRCTRPCFPFHSRLFTANSQPLCCSQNFVVRRKHGSIWGQGHTSAPASAPCTSTSALCTSSLNCRAPSSSCHLPRPGRGSAPRTLPIHFKGALRLERQRAASCARPPPPPPLRTNLRTNRTRRVPHPVLIGHAASLTPRAP